MLSAPKHLSSAILRPPSSVLCHLSFWKNKRVFITGHTGFKGSWLAFWLQRLGSEVKGYSLKPPTEPNHYDLLKMDIDTAIGDICDLEKLARSIRSFKPEIVFHLAAQSLVRLSYEQPVNTFATNVMGTLNVFEACRRVKSVRAIINVTSDKCYENYECNKAYLEDDRMGRHDPYSASKGCSELLTNCYRKSYFDNDLFSKEHNTLIASCRAGNVIGGGDWAKDRLIPDIMRSASRKKAVEIRNPKSIRPWQHVLEPLNGYLILGQKLLEGEKGFAGAWNFGPIYGKSLFVEDVVKKIKNYWNKIDYKVSPNSKDVHEAGLLKIDSSKAKEKLKWAPVWDGQKALEVTANWYRSYYEDGEINTESDISAYEKR